MPNTDARSLCDASRPSVALSFVSTSEAFMDAHVSMLPGRMSRTLTGIFATMRVMDSLGARIKKLREGAGLSQGQLAKKIGVTRSAISQLESDTTAHTRPENLVGFARVFSISVEDMVRGTTAGGKMVEAHSAQPSSHVMVLSNDEAELFERIGGDSALARRLIELLDVMKGRDQEPPPKGPGRRRGH